MAFRLILRRFMTGTAVAVAGLAAVACQSSGPLGALNMAGNDDKPPQQEQVKQEELYAYCPAVELRQGTAYYDTYQKGGKGDRSKLVYQASISDVTRKCRYGAGTVNIDVAVAGRVVPGPVGTGGTVTMPIRVAVLRGSDVLYSKLHKYQVQVSDTAGATQFIFNDPSVTIPTPDSQNIRIFAGYDEGPYDTP